MIVEEIRNIKSGKKELRKFGMTFGIILGLLGGWFLWRDKEHYSYFLILSIAFGLLGLIVPVVLMPVYKAWMTLAVLLGWLMTRVILIVLFYVVVTPIGLLTRSLGKDFLRLKFDRNTDSYWIPKSKLEFGRDHYENQF